MPILLDAASFAGVRAEKGQPLVLQGEGKRLEALEDEEEKEDGGDPEEKCEAKSPRCEEEDS